MVPIFVYHCLTAQSFKVYTGHKRIFDYVEDTVRTFANIMDNFIPGEVYNVGSNEEWVIDIEELAHLVIEETGADPSLAHFQAGPEPDTTMVKIMDFSKARRDLNHEAKVELREGIQRYADWMRSVYSV